MLSPACADLLSQIQRERRVDPSVLITFERDPWITRAWTYQEVVNSQRLRFVVESGSDASVDGQELLSHVGKAIADYKQDLALDAFGFRSQHPALDALEDLIADWLTAAYEERTAYQVLATTHARVSEQPDDLIYAMLGAISSAPFDPRSGQSVAPAEHFMRLCEAKGDFSFIYTSGPRSTEPGRHWRPNAESLRAVFPWHTFGSGQSGILTRSHLELHGMQRLTPGVPTGEARRFLETLVPSAASAPSPATVPRALAPGRVHRSGYAPRARRRLLLSAVIGRVESRARPTGSELHPLCVWIARPRRPQQSERSRSTLRRGCVRRPQARRH